MTGKVINEMSRLIVFTRHGDKDRIYVNPLLVTLIEPAGDHTCISFTDEGYVHVIEDIKVVVQAFEDCLKYA